MTSKRQRVPSTESKSKPKAPLVHLPVMLIRILQARYIAELTKTANKAMLQAVDRLLEQCVYEDATVFRCKVIHPLLRILELGCHQLSSEPLPRTEHLTAGDKKKVAAVSRVRGTWSPQVVSALLRHYKAGIHKLLAAPIAAKAEFKILMTYEDRRASLWLNFRKHRHTVLSKISMMQKQHSLPPAFRPNDQKLRLTSGWPVPLISAIENQIWTFLAFTDLFAYMAPVSRTWADFCYLHGPSFMTNAQFYHAHSADVLHCYAQRTKSPTKIQVMRVDSSSDYRFCPNEFLVDSFTAVHTCVLDTVFWTIRHWDILTRNLSQYCPKLRRVIAVDPRIVPIFGDPDFHYGIQMQSEAVPLDHVQIHVVDTFSYRCALEWAFNKRFPCRHLEFVRPTARNVVWPDDSAYKDGSALDGDITGIWQENRPAPWFDVRSSTLQHFEFEVIRNYMADTPEARVSWTSTSSGLSASSALSAPSSASSLADGDTLNREITRLY